MRTEKVYKLNGCKLSVVFEPKLIRITGADALQRVLSKAIEARTEALVNAIKTDYLKSFNQELAISNESIMVEIWGHVFATYLAEAIKNLVDLELIDKAADRVLKRSTVIDCGEEEVDDNRKFWDVLANFKNLIINFLPEGTTHSKGHPSK